MDEDILNEIRCDFRQAQEIRNMRFNYDPEG
jgi:hypothetical protein